MKNIKFKFLGIILCAFTLCLGISVVGCKKKSIDLTPYLSQLNSRVYLSQGEEKLKAVYGFTETPFINDGKIGDKVFNLNFTLYADPTDECEYAVAFNYNQTAYSKAFTLNAVKGVLTCAIVVEDFTPNEFTVTLSKGNEESQIIMKNALPNNTITYKQALDSLLTHQKPLVESFYDQNGVFNGEIRLRIIVKDGKAFWYVGLIDSKGSLKALLVDGQNGEILAVREVI